MAFSHRDHRARRELRQLYIGFAIAVGGLAAIAILLPNETVRLLAVAGLAAAGAAYVIAADRLAEGYQRDLAAVRAGAPISGAVRAEVYDEVGFERDRGDDWTPSPHRRHPEVESDATGPDAPEDADIPTSSARSDPPSGGP